MELMTLADAGHSMVGPIVIRPDCQVMLPVGWDVDKLTAVYAVSEVSND